MTTATAIQFKLAEQSDAPRVRESFMASLKELFPLGHDIYPTEKNIDFFWEFFFEPAIVANRHGIVLATGSDECIGALFVVPERTRIDGPKWRAIHYGIWVHPEHRRKGISKAMQDVSFGRMRDLGCTQIYSTVLSNNAEAIAACEKSGAKISGFQIIIDL
jgi:RimJ/RimL family protein N-acetyltransferase